MQRIGIYSGTFDPVHDGHVAFARETLRLHKLDKVMFLPERSPRGKVSVTPLGMRAEQIRQAITPYAALGLVVLDQPTFTVADTLPELSQRFPGAQLFILMGSDVARSLPTWPGLAQLLTTTSLIVGLRNADTAEAIQDILSNNPLFRETQAQVAYIRTDFAHLSSSHLRTRTGD
jgi:nicotinate-nucleotide adenylyltransferase